MPSQKNKPTSLSRRDFLSQAPMLGLGAFLLPGVVLQKDTPMNWRDPKPWVIHVRDDNATYWDFTSGWYGYHVDQGVIDAMVERGLKALTGCNTTAKAWARLIPGYVSGEKIAIKVNFNNYSSSGPDPDSDINALIEPVNALISTLVQFGVDPADVTVYDVTHGWHNGGIPQVSFINRCLHSNVKFEAYVGNPAPYSATEKVVFGKPNLPDLAICNALVQSDYLINMPLVKAHPYGYVTLGFKNHFGSIDSCQQVHSYLPSFGSYDPTYSPMIDIFMNPHFGAKTVLTVGDGLFGNWYSVGGAPRKWVTFGNQAPSSLFFASDPVAMDSVLTDFVDLERQAQGYGPVPRKTRDFLKLAQANGLGQFDTGVPSALPGGGYRKINYGLINGVG